MKNLLIKTSIIVIFLLSLSSIFAATGKSETQFVIGATQGLSFYDTGYIGLHSSDFDLRAGLAIPDPNTQLWTLMGYNHVKLTKTENMLYGIKLVFVTGSSNSTIGSIDLGIQHQLSEKLLFDMTWSAYTKSLTSSGSGLVGNVTSFYLTYIL